MNDEEVKTIAKRVLQLMEGKSYPVATCRQMMIEDCLAAVDAIRQEVLRLIDDVEYNTDHDLELRIWEDAAAMDGPAEISAETVRLLDRIQPNVFTVNKLAKEITSAIVDEHRRRDSDMVPVIQTLDAILSPLKDWLKDRSLVMGGKP
jgi:hypothetical protein